MTGGPDANFLPTGNEALGKLVVADRDILCGIVEVGAETFDVHVFAPIPLGKDMAIELADGFRANVAVVDAGPDRLRLRLVDARSIRRPGIVGPGLGPRRHVRLRMRLDGVLHVSGESVPITFRDMSLQGGRIECPRWLLMDQPLLIETPVAPPIKAHVRWRDHPRFGLVFDTMLDPAELARICLAAATHQP